MLQYDINLYLSELLSIDNEENLVVVLSTNQSDVHQPLEKGTQDVLPIMYFRVTANFSLSKRTTILGEHFHPT